MSLIRLKSREEIVERDPWWDGFGIPLPDGTIRRKTLDEYYAGIERMRLNPAVPENVQQPFETARNIYLYSYFAHRFLMVAELQVRISVEFALREKALANEVEVQEWWGLKHLVDQAIKQGWIVDVGFEIFRHNEAARQRDREMWPEMFADLPEHLRQDQQRYCKIIAESFPKIRNTLAHGSNMLYSSVLGSFEIAADLINQLFAGPIA